VARSTSSTRHIRRRDALETPIRSLRHRRAPVRAPSGSVEEGRHIELHPDTTSWYSLDLHKRLGYEHEAVRIGFIHYNTPEEVDRLIAGLESAPN
jgi:hypothetical protein